MNNTQPSSRQGRPPNLEAGPTGRNPQLSYWEEYAAAKADALKMAAKLSARERGTVVTGLKRGMCNEASHDQTRRRRFERAFRSLDRPDENGVTWDYGDCERAMKRMLRTIDAPYRERRRALRFAAMLEYVPEEWRPLLGMIRDGTPRRKAMQACGLPRATYYRRIEAMRRMARGKDFENFFGHYLCGFREGRGVSGRDPRETPRAKS